MRVWQEADFTNAPTWHLQCTMIQSHLCSKLHYITLQLVRLGQFQRRLRGLKNAMMGSEPRHLISVIPSYSSYRS